jgi:hypothetical protein
VRCPSFSYSRSTSQPVRPPFAFSHSVATTYWQSESTSTHACHEMHRMGDVEMTTAASSASCGLLRLGCALNQARPRQPSPKGRCVTYPCSIPPGFLYGWLPMRRQYVSPNVSDDAGGRSYGYASTQQAFGEHCQRLCTSVGSEPLLKSDHENDCAIHSGQPCWCVVLDWLGLTICGSCST